MDLSSAIQLGELATCSICKEFFTDPMTVDCGHNFCSRCLTRYMAAKDLEISCPECKHPFSGRSGRSLKPNKQLASLVEIVQKMTVQSDEASHGSLCREHGEKLQLFCETSGTSICLVCKESSTHKEHRDRPIKEAEQQYKDKFQGFLSSLREVVTDILEKRTQDEEASQMLSMEQTVAEAGNAHKEKYSSQLSDVNTLMTEIQEMFTKPPVEFLENVKSILNKYESTMFWATEHINQDRKVLVTLDPDTASKWLILSEDGKRVTWTDQPQPLPDHPKRFVASECVLGTEGFTSGRHYWEMHFLTDGPGWSVGVAGQSVNRQNEVREVPDLDIWALGNWDGNIKALTSSRTLLYPHQVPKKLVVYLDYEAERLSLFNMDTNEHLYTFTDIAFSGAVYPYFKIWRTDLRLL